MAHRIPHQISCHHNTLTFTIKSALKQVNNGILSNNGFSFGVTRENNVNRLLHILGDPGAVSGSGKKAKRARKKIRRRKVTNESRSPWDSSLNRPVPKPFKILACDWAQKYFLCPIRVKLFSCYFRDFLFEGVHRQTFCSPVRHLFTCSCRRVSLDRKVPLKREP